MLVAVQGCPGTGKTTLLTKIFVEKSKEGTPVYETFRKNMAYDFKIRVSDENELSKEDMHWVGTTHAICFRLLQTEFNYTRDNVAKSKHYKEFCKRVRLPIDSQEANTLVSDSVDVDVIADVKSPGAVVYTIYSNCINTMTDFDDWYLLPDYMKPSILVSDVPYYIDKWIAYLEKNDLVDFPMMLKKVYDLKLTPYGSVYLADEFHDKTKIQFELFKMWGKEFDYVVVAYDRSQAIYNFWGTNPEFCDIVRREADEFKVLSPSHRLSSSVYNIAKRLLSISGQEVFDVDCVGQTRLICLSMRKFESIMPKIKRCMVLARTNYQLRILSAWLSERGIVHTGRFGWTEKQLNVYSFVWKYRNNVYPIYKHELMSFLKSVEGSKANLKFLETSLPSELDKQHVENAISHRYKVILQSSNPFNHCDFNQNIIQRLATALKFNRNPAHRWFLTTIHGAKGLEDDIVVVFDGVTNRIMHSMMRYEEEYKNEYRVWYVALTRARKLCIVVDDSLFGHTYGFVFPHVSRWA